jgi:uncharacterized protein YjaZ
MSRKHKVIKQKTKTRLIFNISQREIKELHCPVSADESQIKAQKNVKLCKEMTRLYLILSTT